MVPTVFETKEIQMKLCYLRWNDALAVEGDTGPPRAELATLEEVGFLLDETPEAVLIGMETHGPTPGRWRLSVPRGQILEMRVRGLLQAFPPPRKPKVPVVAVDPAVVVT